MTRINSTRIIFETD